MTKKEIDYPYHTILHLLDAITVDIDKIRRAVDKCDLDEIKGRVNDMEDCIKVLNKYVYALDELYRAYEEAWEYLEGEERRK